MNKIFKKPIAPTLKSMEIDEKVDFSTKQYSSLNAAISTVSTETGKKFTRKKVSKEVVEVTRLN